MKIKLVDYLCSPCCRSSFEYAVELEEPVGDWTEILEGSLTCTTCGRDYPITRGVPRLVDGRLPDAVARTVAGFGWEWRTFNRQILNTYMTDKANFLDFIHPTGPSFFADRLVLDAGCGMGRFLKLGADFGSREIIGVDLSEAVDAAYENTRHLPNAHVVQADIAALPFACRFDYIFSVGVLQFMDDPAAGFAALTEYLAPEGRISAWVYARENNGWVTRIVTPIRYHVTSRLPHPLLYVLCRGLGLLLYGVLQLIYKPANEGRWAVHLAPRLPYNDYLYYTSRLDYNGLVSIIFDHLVPRLVSYWPRKEFAGWFEKAGLANIVISSRNQMSWRGQGDRAAAPAGRGQTG